MVHSIPSALGIFKAVNNSASHGPHSWKIWFLLIDLLTELNPVQNAHHRFVQNSASHVQKNFTILNNLEHEGLLRTPSILSLWDL